MARKVTALLLAGVIVCVSLGAIPRSSMGSKQLQFSVRGTVYDSYDGMAEIYDDTGNWSIKNITVYPLSLEEPVPPPAVNNGTDDVGENCTEYDTFEFDAEWGAEDDGRYGMVIGESEVNNRSYVFITNFTYDYWWEDYPYPAGGEGVCDPTEWEPIPAPIVYAKGSDWVNLSIPKFQNPQKSKYNNDTPNINNTMGFAVYRSETNNSWTLKVGEATYFDDSYYYFNNTNLSPRTTYYYAVAVIAEGGYVSYGKSAGVEGSTENMIAVNSPDGGENWSGNSFHLINYTIQNGEPTYRVDLYYSINDTNWSFIGNATYNQPGTYTYNWTTPLINSSTVKVMVNVTDNKSATDFDKSDNVFEIDSTAPTVESTSPEDGGSCSLSDPIVIKFNELMNKTSVEEAFSYTNGTKIWSNADGEINWSGNVMTFTPYEEFEIGMQYNCTISIDAKDDSELGNNLAENYTWWFVAAPGRGNFSIEVVYPPSTVILGEKCQIKVTITNGLDAENRSGGLMAKFLKSSDGEAFSVIDTKLLPGMFPNNSTIIYVNFTLPEGNWWLKVNISLLSKDDVIMGSTWYYETSTYTIEVLAPGERVEEERELGPWPLLLIAVMMIAVVIIAFLVLLSLKKKGELVLRRKKEDEEVKKE